MHDDKISADLIKTYQDDGVVCLRGVIGKDWLDLLAEAFEEVETNPSEHSARIEEGGRFFLDLDIWRSNPKARRFILESPLASMAGQLMGASYVTMYGDQLLLKDPGCETGTPWHQDFPFFPLKGDQSGAFWLGLDPVTKESGAVQFVRGSHRWEKIFMTSNLSALAEDHNLFDPDADLSRRNPPAAEEYHPIPDVDADPAAFDLVCYEMEPGDCTFHHVKVLHGAGKNARLDVARRGWSIRMCGDQMTYYNRVSNRDFDAPALPDGAPVISDIYPKLWP